MGVLSHLTRHHSVGPLVLSLALTVVVLAIWIELANANGWGRFTGWGMAHGGFAVAIPISFVLSVPSVYVVRWIWRRRKRDGESFRSRHY